MRHAGRWLRAVTKTDHGFQIRIPPDVMRATGVRVGDLLEWSLTGKAGGFVLQRVPRGVEVHGHRGS